MYECHVTIDAADKEKAAPIAELNGFHMSAIDGDEIMGPGVKAYCTKSGAEYALHSDMENLCDHLEVAGIKWQRRKVEHIVRDERPETATRVYPQGS